MPDYADYPVDGPAGTDPLLLACALLALLALSACAYWLGRHREAGRAAGGHRRVAEDIYEAIALKASAAAAASTDSVAGHARALIAEIDGRLGPVRTLAGGLGPRLKALDEALEGKAEKPHHGKPDAKHDEHGHGGDEPASERAPAYMEALVPSPDDGEVLTRGLVAIHRPAPSPHASHDAHHQPPMSYEEQLLRVRLAAERFWTWWKARDARVAEICAAQRALCHTPPVPRRSPVSHRH